MELPGLLPDRISFFHPDSEGGSPHERQASLKKETPTSYGADPCPRQSDFACPFTDDLVGAWVSSLCPDKSERSARCGPSDEIIF
jgi:hypothetical protein